jgi:predicted nucleotidyltransferase
VIPGVEARIRQREEALVVARSYVGRLAIRYPDLVAVVFGSIARGDFHDGSDTDLLLVSEGFSPDFMQRQKELYEPSPGGIDLFGYTPQELRRMLTKNHPTAHGAREDGMVIRNEAEWAELVGK